MEFNEKLQKLRKQKNLTQEELARAIYVSRTAISKWESGRGYPSIDSLKAIAQFFGVTIDQLLSGGEALTIAGVDQKQKDARLRAKLFALLDLGAALLLFLPLFADRMDGGIRAVSLAGLNTIAVWLRIAYFALVIGMIASGALGLILSRWERAHLRCISFALHVLLALLLIAGSQPYGAAYLLMLLLIKGFLLLKPR